MRTAFTAVSWFAAIFATDAASAQSAAPVPSLYEAIYNSLDASINSFAATVDNSWNGVPNGVTFAAELPSASSSVGDRLLDPDRYSSVVLELDSLQAIGVKAVNVQMYFPILYAGYYSSDTEYQQYIEFYRRLAADIHARGMKLIARCSLMMSQQGFSTIDMNAYYQSLTLEQYKAGRIDTVAAVVRQIRPDYVVVMNEPDSEASQSGKPEIASVTGSTEFLRTLVAAVRATGIPVSIGAGVGTWAGRYEEYIQSFLATNINFLDLHVYPANRDFLPRLITGADLAQGAGKGVAISEAWLQKVSDTELGATPVQTLFARDPFSFWAPLDEKFLRALVRFSHYRKLLFLSPFWTQYFHAYVDYNAVSSLTPAEVNAKAGDASAEALANGKFTSTALAYARAIATTPDITRPVTPTALTAYTLSNNAIHLTWAASTDNIGVAGYRVYRNGVLVGTTAYLFWQDIGLSPVTTYAYTIAAYDVAGNVSPATPVVNGRTNSTADTTPPSVPAPVTGAPMSGTQIELRWGRSTDNVKVVGYKVFRSGTEIAQTTTASFSDIGLFPNTTYSYAVAATDNSGNVSARSAPVQVATAPRDTQAPSAPTDVTAVAGRDVVYLSWTRSSDNVAVVGYRILRSDWTVMSSSVFTYQDTNVKPSATYTYRVIALDANGNVSPASAPVTVTTPDTLPPAAPGTPSGVPVSPTQIRLSWPAATDNIKIAGYRIFRNGSYVAGWGLTQYLDSGLTPSTVYTYTVVAVDSSGNESAPSSGCTVSTAAPDTQAPTAPSITAIAAMSTSQVNLGWTPSTDNTKVAGYHIYRDSVKIGQTGMTSYSDTGLSAGTTYTYTVRGVDAYGLTSVPSAGRTVTTLPLPDTTPPTVPQTVSVYGFSPTQLLIVWTASTDSNRVASYRIYRNGSNVGTTQIPICVDANLSPATTYQYTVVAIDAAGNASPASAPATGATLPAADRISPTVPGSVSAVASASNRVSVGWGASSDNVRVAGYKIFRNGSLIAIPIAPPFLDTLVVPNTTYTYTVAGFDASGNVSAQSAGAVVTTPR